MADPSLCKYHSMTNHSRNARKHPKSGCFSFRGVNRLVCVRAHPRPRIGVHPCIHARVHPRTRGVNNILLTCLQPVDSKPPENQIFEGCKRCKRDFPTASHTCMCTCTRTCAHAHVYVYVCISIFFLFTLFTFARKPRKISALGVNKTRQQTVNKK
jgi:hypothetical protein